MNSEKQLVNQIRTLLYIFIVGLAVSGITAFPIHTQLAFAKQLIGYFEMHNSFTRWMEVVYDGVDVMDKKYPFLAYGTDWLAFAHLVLAVLFAGVIRDPVRNIWVLQFGLIACLGIFPLAFIAGTVRGIPFFWQLIDCSFGLFGGTVLWMCYARVRTLERTGCCLREGKR